jgi:hypothetical protein
MGNPLRVAGLKSGTPLSEIGMPGSPVYYTPGLETVEPDETQTHQELVETFRSIIETTHRDHGHAFRGVHAKSHGQLEGELTVLPGLAPEFAQGLFAVPAGYPVLMRISTNAGDPLPTASRSRAASPSR